MEMHLYYDREFILNHNGLYIEHTVAYGDKTVHTCPYYMLVYAAHGKGRHFIENTDHDFAEGDILLVNPDTEHCVYSIPNQRGMSIYCCSFLEDILPCRMEYFIKDFPKLKGFLKGEIPCIHVHDTPQSDVLSLMIKMMDNYTYLTPCYALAITSQLTEALIDILRISSDDSPSESFNTNTIVGHATSYVRLHVKEKISLNDVAEQLHISVQHLCRVFKKNTGMTFSEYVNRMRVEKMRHELVYTDRPLYIICGDFELTSKHLNRIFRQYTGLSMQEYKDKYNYKSQNPLYKWVHFSENENS